jgi:hypothetical protein
LQAGFEILERHAHSQVIAGSLAEKGRDATVFWNYVDLRFRADHPFQICAELTATELRLEFRGIAQTKLPSAIQPTEVRQIPVEIGNCATCGKYDCHRALKPTPRTSERFRRTAILVDEHSPEFDALLPTLREGPTDLFMPLDGKKFGKANYAWNRTGFAKVHQAWFVTLERAIRSRKLATQGAARQKNLLAMADRLATSYARRLRHDHLHLVIAQPLLPYLWREGHLGGRTFDVLMNALPIQEIESRLNQAAKLHPESPTLADFRADPELALAEAAALRQARRIFTPHREIAACFSQKSTVLPWSIPTFPAAPTDRDFSKPTLYFPASTLGRKGAYELREALRGTSVRILLGGPNLEVAEFWEGFDAHHLAPQEPWWKETTLVVFPAFVEHRPRRLLQAVARGIPVIASTACGLSGMPGMQSITPGSLAELRAALGPYLPIPAELISSRS